MKSIAIASLTCAITSMSAHAGIIYTECNVTLTNTSSSVQNIAGAEFEFGIAYLAPGSPPPHCAYFAPMSDNAAVFMWHLSGVGAQNFSEGEPIDMPVEYLRGPVEGSGPDGYANWFSAWQSYGVTPSEAYTGFVVGSGDDRKVGWAHMTFDYGSSPGSPILISATMTGWAYNNAPGGSIMAGQTEAVAVPGAGGLAALIGVAGLRRRRRS